MMQPGYENDEPHIKIATRGRYYYSSPNPAHWRPWGLYDHLGIPPPSEQAFSKALELLNIDNPEQRLSLMERLKEIAVRFWQIRRSFEQPPVKWYRDNTEAISEGLQEVLTRLKRNRAALSGLNHLVLSRMDRRLFRNSSSDLDSIEAILEGVVGVCSYRIRRLTDESGRPTHKHVRAAVSCAAKLWKEVRGKQVPLSLGVKDDEHWEFGSSTHAFTSIGPLFVQAVLQGIDPALDVGTIGTALRNTFGGRPKKARRGQAKKTRGRGAKNKRKL
jgi:hypothetical protein